MRKRNFEYTVKRVINAIIKKGAIPLGYGRHKAAFAKGNYVYRVPTSISAFGDMLIEAETYKATDSEGRFNWKSYGGKYKYIMPAKTRLVIIKDIPIQIMEKVIPCTRSEAFSFKDQWLKDLEDSGDGRQVGKNIDGHIRVFDFSEISCCLDADHEVRVKSRTKTEELMNHFGSKGYWLDTDFLSHKGTKYSPGSPDSYFLSEKIGALTFTKKPDFTTLHI